MVEPDKSAWSRSRRALYFLHLLEGEMPDKLSWTQVSLACSTVFSIITGAATAFQSVTGSLAHSDWAAFLVGIGWHGASHIAARVKQHTETK